MLASTLAHWTMLVNTRFGSTVTDATPKEVAAAMKALASDKGAVYVRTFLKKGRSWRVWIDSDDVNALIDLISYTRTKKAA